MQTAAPGATARKVPIVRVVLASLIGTAVEWYDFFLYGSAAALVFGTLFFPKANPVNGTLLAFGTYALGFVARPLGGVVFGHYGDRVGRKRMLIVSLMLMGVSTVAIGVLPTYGKIGVGAPVLLLVCRLLQGFAVGGEWGGAVLLAAENGDDSKRGFWSSWPQAGVALGNMLSTAVLWILAVVQSDKTFDAWGWRIPFLLSAVLVMVGLWVRLSIEESPLFKEALARRGGAPHQPLLEVIRKYPREFFAELFGTSVRYTGASVGYQLASILAGALAPIIALKLLGTVQQSDTRAVAIYMTIASVITIVSVLLTRETAKSSLQHDRLTEERHDRLTGDA